MKFLKLIRFIGIIIVISVSAGCATPKQHGAAAPDTEVRKDGGTKVIMPDNAPSISQGFRPVINEGLDIISNSGTPVIAAAGGTVLEALFESLYGNQILIEHGQDENGNYIRSSYRHLEKLKVKKGNKVTRGQQIGTVGTSGVFAGCYPFLHYEIHVGDTPDQSRFKKVNPHSYWVDGPGVVTCYDSSKQLPDSPFKTTYPIPCSEADSE